MATDSYVLAELSPNMRQVTIERMLSYDWQARIVSGWIKWRGFIYNPRTKQLYWAPNIHEQR